MRRLSARRVRRRCWVDDNEDAADTLAEMLEVLGYDVAVAHDGPSALITAAHFRPEIALLDIGLPVMDGYELARQLRTNRELGYVRLVALTGYGQASDRIQTRNAGFDEHLVKPVAFEVLTQALEGDAR